MGFIIRLIIGIPAICIGIILIVKSYKIVQKIGYNDWAEEHMGDGGTYTLVKIIGMLLIFLSMLGILGVVPLPF